MAAWGTVAPQSLLANADAGAGGGTAIVVSHACAPLALSPMSAKRPSGRATTLVVGELVADSKGERVVGAWLACE